MFTVDAHHFYWQRIHLFFLLKNEKLILRASQFLHKFFFFFVFCLLAPLGYISHSIFMFDSSGGEGTKSSVRENIIAGGRLAGKK